MTESLERYTAARDEIADALEALRATLAPAATWYDAASDLDALAARAALLRTGRFVLAVVGEFSSGKSFLLNVLLGKVAREERMGTTRITGLLATDINPSTATITELSYAPEEIAVAHFADGRRERVPIDMLARFETGGEAAVLRVGVDSPFLKNGFVVADTPGLASVDPAHRRATLRYLPGADAVLYLIDTQQPFADGDAAFLGIVRRSIESIFIVQTKIDLWRARQGDREIWEAAAARIVAQTAEHAPGTPVFPLSARDYAEGRLTSDDELVEQSRFLPFLAALDASLVATTGRSRLTRAAVEARRVAQRAAEACALDAAALERDPQTLAGERAAIETRLNAVDAAAADGRERLLRTGTELRAAVTARGLALRAELARTIARAFDITDIARLRDRPRLHGIVDATVAAAMEGFAGEIARLVTQNLHDTAQSVSAALASEPLPLAADAARAFDADPASGAWSVDLATGVRSTIVIGALGGVAVTFVAAIAERFAAARFGTYMKRELIADMDIDLAPAFEHDVERFVDDVGERLDRVAGFLAERVGGLALRARIDGLGAIDRAQAVEGGRGNRSAMAAALRARSAGADAAVRRIEERAAAFALLADAERRSAPIPRIEAAPSRGAGEGNRFDPDTYEHGLHPERWRVAVVGAWKRGKSSLINALAGRPVLADADDAAFRFPVHVRYGPEPVAYALTEGAAWEEIPADGVRAAAARTPVLVLVPWSLPHDLVLVHAPAFDAGVPAAEEIVSAAAGAASEILALFSRQLSDVELELYGRLARLGKPLTFVHTLADHETPAERRRVVTLAGQYLRDRAISTPRIFTVSTRERGGWNELDALRGTLAAHAEEHMERLRRVQREQAEQARLASSVAQGPQRKPSLFERILGGRR